MTKKTASPEKKHQPVDDRGENSLDDVVIVLN
jgi:hypothetical protein